MHFFEERKIESLAKKKKKTAGSMQLVVEPAVCSAVRAMEKGVVCAYESLA